MQNRRIQFEDKNLKPFESHRSSLDSGTAALMRLADSAATSARLLAPSGHGQFPLKINVHLELPVELLRHCINLNAKIGELTETEIDFRCPSLQKPHITLGMGYCTSAKNLQGVLCAVEHFCRNLPKVSISPQRPYLKLPKKNYLFIDLVECGEVIELKRQLDVVLVDNIIPMDWNVVEEPPHITIAYCRNPKSSLEEAVSKLSGSVGGTCESIGVSVCGPRGSCLGTLRSFPLDLVNK